MPRDKAATAEATHVPIRNQAGAPLLATIEDQVAEVETDLAALETAFNDHSARHENAGADEINVAGLSGLLADAQTPLAHKVSHQNGGGDEITVAGLNGVLADPQTVAVAVAGALDGTGAAGSPLAVKVDGVSIAINGSNEIEATGSPGAHAADHEDGGADEIDVTGLSGLLADPQTPAAHTHAQADVTDLVSDLADLAADIGTVAMDLGLHLADTTNPHAVTAAQVGALTAAQVLMRVSLRG